MVAVIEAEQVHERVDPLMLLRKMKLSSAEASLKYAESDLQTCVKGSDKRLFEKYGLVSVLKIHRQDSGSIINLLQTVQSSTTYHSSHIPKRPTAAT